MEESGVRTKKTGEQRERRSNHGVKGEKPQSGDRSSTAMSPEEDAGHSPVDRSCWSDGRATLRLNQRQIMTFVLSFGSTFWLPLPIQKPFHYPRSQHGQGFNVECSYSPMVTVGVRSEDPSVYAVKGRGLAFLIKNLYYEDIAVNITNTLDLEAQGIKVYLNQNKAINIYNMYHPPNNTFIDDGTMAQFLTDNTIIVGNSYQISSKIKVEKRPERLFMTVKMSPALIIFSMKKINMKELAYALENTDLNKTPGPDGIHGRMISNLDKIGKERLLNIFNNSWKTGKLPQDCKNATIIPIKKLDKSADDPKKLPTYLPHKFLLQINGNYYTQTTHLPPRHKKSLSRRTIWI
ncbi:hypothetical protein LAZ67_18000422 [Cordylochernes scorpioides]|uniref:Uncharacterized protein n=1 Tax=Cordylochernes scorpioides TaxID=51811 RepID=A0ABY6LF90_9ARAC|nr:hypothetical protein LAZ67_18000422 [Cordylochernes scorpioides]